MARNLLIFPAIFLILFSGACSQAGTYMKVIDGNYEYSRGDYKESNFTYIQALQYNRYTDRIAYNLGNVYHSLGESEAALEEWDNASFGAEDPELLLRIAFNRGVLYYELGNYQEAYTEFRRVLTIEPDDIEAKANLEYCLGKLNLSEGSQETKNEDEEEGERNLSEDGKRILEYVRRSGSSSLAPDYKIEEVEPDKNW